MDYIEVTLDKKVLKQLGYEVKYINRGLFGLFGDDELVSFKKNGKDVANLDIPATYMYNGQNYKITEIDSWAFNACSSLTSVTIPSSVKKIGHRSFGACISLRSVIILEGVIEIDSCVFDKCSSLTSVTIPNGVTKIGDWAFNECHSLRSVTIPSSVTQIGYRAFSLVPHIEYHGTATGAPWEAKSMN